ncbi:hypothetical protein [Ralstonia sp.]|uniref:hypothetical protein n=1 Tax=Ralstonia sp. TaxID=54061 RepID=UPI0031CE79D8
MRKPTIQNQVVQKRVSAIAHQGADEIEVACFFLKSLRAVIGSIDRLNVDTNMTEAAREVALHDLMGLARYLVDSGTGGAEHAARELREIADGVRHG